ncbi:hypothetical protein HaLaN_11446 [Haematococcus lacustris]|uniref:Uncharacterized protein n=1 Tax=Haematococcus lacustris TaxID=44745 RepID=A0A699YZU4_HAELA|nr:hypothetical protein HaLaN_11446 [Haematococcus lacustris]
MGWHAACDPPGVVQQLRAINKVDASLALRGEHHASLAALASVSHRILTISMSHALHTGCSTSSCAKGGARAYHEERVPNRESGHLTSDVDRLMTDHATSALLRVLGHVRVACEAATGGLHLTASHSAAVGELKKEIGAERKTSVDNVAALVKVH